MKAESVPLPSARKERRLSPDARRQAIMDAARGLFLTKGFATTSLEEIVAISGGSLSTVYQLFGNKQGLWEALVAEVCDQVTAPLQDAMTHHGDTRTVLKEFAVRLDALERSTECAGAMRMLMTEGTKYPELALSLFATGPDAANRIVADYLKAEAAAGHLKVDDAALAAEHFGALVCGDTRLRNACGVLPEVPPEEIERRLNVAVDLFLKAYGP